MFRKAETIAVAPVNAYVLLVAAKVVLTSALAPLTLANTKLARICKCHISVTRKCLL
jgi:FlaG/FlaF family flagellin (archaellin)